MILFVLPKSWGVSKIQAEFGAIGYVAELSKNIVQENQILTKPKRKQNEGISKETIQLVNEFFKNDLVSRMMPGKKDCVSMKVNGIREKIQKCLILCTL